MAAESSEPPAELSKPDSVIFPSVEDSSSHITSSSSKLTSSDKLTALPSTPTPQGRIRTTPSNANRLGRLSLDGASLPSFESLASSPPFQNTSLLARASASDGSVGKGKDSPKQRVSFDSDRGTPLPALHSVRQAFTRSPRRSDPPLPSSHRDGHKRKYSTDTPPGSRSHSRANSPLRIFQWSGLHRAHSREEPFVPVDPFKRRLRFTEFQHHRQQSMDEHDHADFDYCGQPCCICLPLPSTCTPAPSARTRAFLSNAHTFVLDTLPRQVYLHLLLRLPSLYFSRVARIFEDAEVSRPDIQRMIDACNVPQPEPLSQQTTPPGVAPPLPFPEDWNPPTVSPALARFKLSWEDFIGSLLKEWKTLNVVSALLLSAILAIFQIPSAGDDPLTRTIALLSLSCALMSLSYGCVYIVRFGTMRSMVKASKWAEEARKTNTWILWNIWVLLAMPAVWLAWSMILFIACILCFVWRTGSTSDPDDRDPLSPRLELGPRIAVTAVLLLGIIYFALIVNTLRSYGSVMTARERDVARSLGLGPLQEEPRRGRELERGGGSSSRGSKREAEPERKEKAVEASRLRQVTNHASPSGSGSEEKEKGDVVTSVSPVEKNNLKS